MLFALAIFHSLKIVHIYFNGVLGSLWYWNCILVGFIAIFYILKIHKFYLWDFLASVAFGFVAFIYGGFNLVLTPIMVFAHYAACCIFRKYNLQKTKFAVETKNIFKSFGFGILVGAIPAILNVIEYYVQDGYKLNPINLTAILPGAAGALQPGIF